MAVFDSGMPGDVVTRDADRLRQRLELLDRLERHRFEPALVPEAIGDDAQVIEATLLAENDSVYESIRDAIRDANGRYDLLAWLRRSPDDAADALDDGYDHRDEILAGVLQLAEPGSPRITPTSEMVFYQPTPARHIVELIERTALGEDDVLVDLGRSEEHTS